MASSPVSTPDFRLPLEPGTIGRGVDVGATVSAIPFESTNTVSFLFQQNGRVLIASTFLAAITFGVVALVLNPITFAVLGFLTCQLIITGNDPGIILATILPHGWVEIPVILIATAAAVRLGAVVTRLPRGKTVGQAWIEALGDTIKLAVGVVIPGLLIAAVLEAVLTSAVVSWYLGV
ncbi:MAG: stage II sporulation protein M [Chloroflexi bacterium]|nr:stage II sporulation protein M [Chloroflexota bacterium]